jgi:uncharacterized protein with HEPN domain
MSDNSRNVDVLKKIVVYCERISEYVERFGNSIDVLESDTAYKDATAMCILQIGELTKHLSDDFKACYTDIPWKQIVNMRNVAAHGYGDFSVDYLWDAIVDDVPKLRDYCNGILRCYEVCEQEAIEEPDEEPDMEQGQKMF